MSHRATNWAFQLKGLSPISKLLMLQLADRHNGDTGRCDPSQERLAEDMEVSRRSIGRHLETLIEKGLIRRTRVFDAARSRYRNDSYELALEGLFDPVPEGDGSANTVGHPVQSRGTSCPEIVTGCPSNLVREPGTEPVCGEASEPTLQDGEQPSRGRAENDERLFERYWTTHPRPHDQSASRVAWIEALASGVDAELILTAVAAYAAEQRGNARQYIKCSDTWLTDRRWRDHAERKAVPAGKVGSLADAARFWAGKVRDKRPISSSAISTPVAAAMIEMRLVTVDQLRAAGVAT